MTGSREDLRTGQRWPPASRPGLRGTQGVGPEHSGLPEAGCQHGSGEMIFAARYNRGLVVDVLCEFTALCFVLTFIAFEAAADGSLCKAFQIPMLPAGSQQCVTR